MKKKFLGLLLASAMMVTSLAGCGNEKNDEPKEKAKQSATKKDNKQNDIFTYIIAGDTGNTLNPLTANDRYTLMTSHMINAPAYSINPDGTTTFILAESMEASEDGLSYTMKLKPDLKWSDDEPITADDVVYTYTKSNEFNHSFVIDGEPIKVEKIDDLTIKFSLPSVSASAYETIANETNILPKHYYEAQKTFDINMLEEQPIGCGPYKLEKYETGQYLKFVKNDNYALGKAKIDEMVFRIIEKNDSAVLAMKNGEADAWVATPDLIEDFEGNDNFNITNYSEGRVAHAFLNVRSKNLKDKKYREGILYALNREEIMMASFNDPAFFEIGYSFLPTSNPFYTDKVEKWNTNIKKAKDLVKGGPKDLSLLYVADDDMQEAQALTIQSELKKIGINVELNGVNHAAWMSKTLTDPTDDYDITLGGYVMGNDPDIYSLIFQSDKGGNMGYNNPKIDKAFIDGNATLDTKKRKEFYNEAQKLVSKEAIFYPFGSNKRTLITSSRVDGIKDAELVPVYTFGDFSKLRLK